MKYNKIKTGFAALSIFAVSLTACNNNAPSDTSDDTTTTAVSSDTSASSSTADTMHSINSADTVSSSAAASTSKPAATAKKKYKASIQLATTSKTHKYTVDKAGIYDYAEVMPQYPGGQSALEDYINDNIQYPQNALDNDDAGRATVKFVVDENGKVTDAKSVGAKLSSGLDAEAVRVVSSLPEWKPGTIKGKPVKVSMTLPVVFKIEQ